MDKLEIEKTETTAHAAAAENLDTGEGKQEFSFKKFKDVESLQKAYSSLESEFTKRSQRLKELEGERLELLSRLEQGNNNSGVEKNGLREEGDKEFYQKFPNAKTMLKDLTVENALSSSDLSEAYIRLLENALTKLNKSLSDENFLISQIEGTTIKDRIIREYLSDIKNSNKVAKLITKEGEAILVPPKKPKSFEEAGMLSKGLFSRERFD